MRPVLLLVPDRVGVPEHLHTEVDVCTGAVGRGADYASVIVVNDGRAGTVERLRQALLLRERCHELQIGVLTWLDEQAAGTLVLTAPSPPAIRGELGCGLKVELKDRLLSVEYQA